MSLPTNSQKRLLSSTRTELARNLHDSIAQDLVAIGFKLDLLISDLPARFRTQTREIRLEVTKATKRVRQELFALRSIESDYFQELTANATPLKLQINGEISKLNNKTKQIVDELVKNAAVHSKGHNLVIDIEEHLIKVKDDGQGMHGVSELVEELGGSLSVTSDRNGTQIEIILP